MLSEPPSNVQLSAQVSHTASSHSPGHPHALRARPDVGLVAGFGLSVGRTVQAEREIEPRADYQERQPHGERHRCRGRTRACSPKCWSTCAREYVENISDQELIEAAIRGMIADLDPHSAFLDPEEFDEIRISTTGEYSGVGIEVALENGVVKVVTPIEDTPAQRAGVLAGDTHPRRRRRAGRTSRTSTTRSIACAASVGTPVKITHRAQSAIRSRWSSRWRAPSVQVHSVTQELLEPGLGYVRISHFSETTTPDLEARDRQAQESERRRAARPGARPAQQSGRRARSGGRRVGRVSRRRRDRHCERSRRRRAVRDGCAARATTLDGAPHHRAGERRLGLGIGDRRRRVAGSSSRARSSAARPTARARCRP